MPGFNSSRFGQHQLVPHDICLPCEVPLKRDEAGLSVICLPRRHVPS